MTDPLATCPNANGREWVGSLEKLAEREVSLHLT